MQQGVPDCIPYDDQHADGGEAEKIKNQYDYDHAEHRLAVQELSQGAIQVQNDERDNAAADNRQRQQHLKQNNTNHALP